MVDATFGVDNFNKPKLLNESQTIANNILTILFGRPNFYPSIPSLGLAIQDTIYAFFDTIDPDALKAQIIYQCSYFTNAVNSGDLEIVKTSYKGNPMLLITIPVTIDKSNTRFAIGITTNANGETVYNYRYDAA